MADVDVPPPPRRTIRMRLVARRGMVAAAVAAMLAGGGIGAGIALAATASSAAPSPQASAATPRGSAGKHVTRLFTRGTITAQSPASWTVRTAAGTTVTVVISAQTHFGTKKRPATRSQFHPGSMVLVGGKTNGSTVSAKVILPAAAHQAAPSGTPSPSASPTGSSFTSG